MGEAEVEEGSLGFQSGFRLERPGVLRSEDMIEGAGEAPPDAIFAGGIVEVLVWCCRCRLEIEGVDSKLEKLLFSCPQFNILLF